MLLCRKAIEERGIAVNLLEYGIKKEQSASPIERALAKGALAAARKKADLYEAYLERRPLVFPDDETEKEKMLQQIKEKIAASQDGE